MPDDLHGNQPLQRAGTELEAASAAMILVHGRGARAEGMLEFANEFDGDGIAYLAPQAHRNTWYPQSFLAPMAKNQPKLDSALARLGNVVETVTSAGVPLERTILLGFSQGGCLSTEFAARNADRYGGVVALSGGLIGPEGTDREYEGTMDGTPVFVGCGDQDPHIPVERVEETAETFERLQADVEKRIYEGVGHTILEDELEYVRDLVADVVE